MRVELTGAVENALELALRGVDGVRLNRALDDIQWVGRDPVGESADAACRESLRMRVSGTPPETRDVHAHAEARG